jgi:D-serine deaminase-like pyridoxal phosphate-dependent protein
MRITEPSATPSLVIDFLTVQENLRKLAQYAQRINLLIRPHTKTHKSLQIAKLQLALGATGLTVAKVGEAEVMAHAFEPEQADLLVAYPVLDSTRTGRLAMLAQSAKICVAIDSVYAASALASAADFAKTRIGVLIDVDCGFHRTGVQSKQDALELAQLVDQQVSLRLDGLFVYPGHLFVAPEQQVRELERLQEYLEAIIGLWREHGLKASTVSGGSTPTAYESHRVPAMTEIRPGTYVFNDMNTVHGGYCEIDDCASRIVCTVVSNAVKGRSVIDAGSKTLSSDRNITKPESGYGYVVEYPDARIDRLSEEHGELDLSYCSRQPRLGERLTIIPNHICACVNLQESVWLRNEDSILQCLYVDAQHKLV